MTIEATAAHVETTTALPSLRPLVCPITHTSLSIHKIPSKRCPHVRTPATTKKMEKLLTIHINVWLGNQTIKSTGLNQHDQEGKGTILST
jgi:hypothetical protein